MEAYKTIDKTQAYLDYVENHIRNVEKAWEVIKVACKDMEFITDDKMFEKLNEEVGLHDISKMSEKEFVQYRKNFYPVEDSEKSKELFDAAWENHKKENPHHWQNWVEKAKTSDDPNEWKINCVHMIIDWMAMGYNFGDTAESYYEGNKDDIYIPEYGIDYIKQIFERIRVK